MKVFMARKTKLQSLAANYRSIERCVPKKILKTD